MRIEGVRRQQGHFRALKAETNLAEQRLQKWFTSRRPYFLNR
jgi:hypothetical protein